MFSRYSTTSTPICHLPLGSKGSFQTSEQLLVSATVPRPSGLLGEKVNGIVLSPQHEYWEV